jgi:Fe2+ transport system protein FeoA
MSDSAFSIATNPDCPQPFVCPLSKVRAGTAVRIKQLSAPPEVTHRLREMGFCEEQKIRLLAQQANVICQVCNVRLGISSQLAEQIIVEPLQHRAAV